MDEDLETRRSVPANSLDVEQIRFEAKNQWLSPAEICEILRNYKRFQIASEPPNMPPSGSFFLFDRKVARNFRKEEILEKMDIIGVGKRMENWQRKVIRSSRLEALKFCIATLPMGKRMKIFKDVVIQ